MSGRVRFHVARGLLGLGACNLGASVWTDGAWWWTAGALLALFAGDALLTEQFNQGNKA